MIEFYCMKCGTRIMPLDSAIVMLHGLVCSDGCKDAIFGSMLERCDSSCEFSYRGLCSDGLTPDSCGYEEEE